VRSPTGLDFSLCQSHVLLLRSSEKEGRPRPLGVPMGFRTKSMSLKWRFRTKSMSLSSLLRRNPPPQHPEFVRCWMQDVDGTLLDSKHQLSPRTVRTHPGGNPEANLDSISHRCHPILVACVWELTK